MGHAVASRRTCSSIPRRLLTSCSPSFGDPNARPPTPQRTPTTAFTSTLPQTPKRASSHFDEASGWTPRFAEEYSVFNSTPGNLRRNSGAPFNFDFAPLSPVPPSTGKKRALSAEGVSVETVTHANRFTADPTNLAPVDPARRLPSSPDLLTLSHKDPGADSRATPRASQAHSQQQQQQGQRSAKKPRKETASGAAIEEPPAPPQTQTATPPPSSRGGRKLAPRLQTENMHSQSFGQSGYASAAPPQQPHINTTFVTGNPEDVFGYPMGPATAPPMTGHRQFWGMDMDTSGMSIDVDLSAAGAGLFETTSAQNQHRPLNSIDWGRANQIFQQPGMVTQQEQQQHQQPPPQQPPPQQQQQQQQQHQVQMQVQGQDIQRNQPTPTRRERPLAPKAANMSTPELGRTTPNQNFSFNPFQMSMDDPFSTSPGGVDPGVLFSQPVTSASVDASRMSLSIPMNNTTPQRPVSSVPVTMAQMTSSMGIESIIANAPMSTENESRRSGNGNQQRKLQSIPSNFISPTKNAGGRPNLSRSFSESARGGKRTVGGGRNPWPALAPARPTVVHQPSLPPPAMNQNNRPQAQGGRPGGRSSPLKSSHHHRLSSLSAIPENAAKFPSRSRSARRTSVKFVIDENGRAHAETVRNNNSAAAAMAIADDEDDDDTDDTPVPLLLNNNNSNNQRSASRGSWGTVLPVPSLISDEEYSSSDDEPIIIPSRNTSFNFPEAPKNSSTGTSRPPTASSILSQGRTQQRSFSDRYPFSSLRRGLLGDQDTADDMDMDPLIQSQGPPQRPSTGGSLGDAAAELRKVMQAGNPNRPGSGQQQSLSDSGNGSGGSSGHRQRFISGQRSSSSTISEASLPATSPTHRNQGQAQVRCVCNRPEAEVDGAQFLVKWFV